MNKVFTDRLAANQLVQNVRSLKDLLADTWVKFIELKG